MMPKGLILIQPSFSGFRVFFNGISDLFEHWSLVGLFYSKTWLLNQWHYTDCQLFNIANCSRTLTSFNKQVDFLLLSKYYSDNLAISAIEKSPVIISKAFKWMQYEHQRVIMKKSIEPKGTAAQAVNKWSGLCCTILNAAVYHTSQMIMTPWEPL